MKTPVILMIGPKSVNLQDKELRKRIVDGAMKVYRELREGLKPLGLR